MTAAPTTTSTASTLPGSKASGRTRAGRSSKRSSRGRGGGGARGETHERLLIAGIHEQGGCVRVVVTMTEPGKGLPRVVDSRTFPREDTAGLASYLKVQKVQSLARVVDSTRTVCRCSPVPTDLISTDRASAASALELMAESELPSMVPAHRRAAGMIRPGPVGSPEAVLYVGWPPKDEPITKLGVKDELWTAELVSLATLAKAMGGARVALYADRDAGSMALIVAGIEHQRDTGATNGTGKHPHARTLARVLRGDKTSETTWRQSVARAIAETQVSIGLPADPSVVSLPEGSTALVLAGGSSSTTTFPGAPSEPNWLSQYGIAYGAILAQMDPDPAAEALATLRAEAPRQRRSLLVGALEWSSTPRHAGIVIAVCVLAMLLWPWAVAAGRLWILSGRTGGQAALQQRLSEADRRDKFYQELYDKRWPMTKLLADIAGSAPKGLTIETLALTREQGLSIHGKAENGDLVTEFAKNLNDLLVYQDVVTPTRESEGSSVQFQLDARVASPKFSGRRKEDYGSKGKTLSDRLYGVKIEATAPGSTSTSAETTPPPAAGVAASGDKGVPVRNRRSEDERSKEDAKAEKARSKPVSANAIPDPLTDAEIAKMDRDTAMKEWTSRKKASAKPDLDAAIKSRLVEEAEKCKARMLEIPAK